MGVLIIEASDVGVLVLTMRLDKMDITGCTKTSFFTNYTTDDSNPAPTFGFCLSAWLVSGLLLSPAAVEIPLY